MTVDMLHFKLTFSVNILSKLNKKKYMLYKALLKVKRPGKWQALHTGCNIRCLEAIHWVEYRKKVQVGKDQEKAQSEKDSHSKNQGGKKPN